jgi:ketosteroid isomerase-like protein
MVPTIRNGQISHIRDYVNVAAVSAVPRPAAELRLRR